MLRDVPAAEPVAAGARPAVVRYQRGMVIKAEGGNFRNIVGSRTVPMDWPDQQVVRVVKEELPPGATITYNVVEGVARQMLVKLPFLAAGKEARVAVTFEVQLLPCPPPVDAATLRLPAASALDRKLSQYLAPGAFIESDDSAVCRTAQEVAGSQANAWDKVQALHEWVKTNVKFAAGAGKERGAAQVLRTRTFGDDADPKCLQVALCRAQGIPARLVIIARPGSSDHCYFEFYLADANGAGHWLAADHAVETMLRPSKPARAVVLQKGDNVTIIHPETKRRVKHRFLADSLQGFPQARDARLQLQLISRFVDATP
jgi:transglutaminase-like putative cysteine protease